ncbi:MAG: hypothetical protein ACTHL8_20220 [Burkholderiaceae bacterium]
MPRRRGAALAVLAAVMAADLRQRLRSGRFRAVALLAVASAWLSFPPAGAGYLVVAVGAHFRGTYSSAWVGMVVAMTALLWSLAGFYVVRGTLARDFDTRVWQLLGASAMPRAGYLVAKWAAQWAALALLVALGLATGLVAQWARAEDRHLDLWELAKPSLFLALPMLAVTAAFAVWFDILPPLRRTAGNVVFFFAWLALLSTGAMSIAGGAHAPAWTSDLPGIELVQRAIDAQVVPQLPEVARTPGFCVGCGPVDGPPRRFAWPRWEVPAAALAGRLLWLAAALAGVLAAVPLLGRAAARARSGGDAPAAGRRPRALAWLGRALAPLQRRPGGVLVAAEVFVVLRLRPAWWWLALVAAWVVQLAAPAHASALAMLGGWLLLLDVFSRAALREREHRTGALVGTAPGGPARLLRARAAAGVGLAWFATAPGLVHAGLVHPSIALAGLAMGASLALAGLACGALAGSGRPFELAVLAAAYASAQGLPWLDASARDAGTLAFHAAAIVVSSAVLAGLAHRRR